MVKYPLNQLLFCYNIIQYQMKDRSSISPYRSGYISGGTSLEEENAILRTKCKKVSELEEKVELVLKHNSQLLVENEKLSKLLHQSKSELEVTKNKLELMGSQRIVASGQDFEIKKLLGENQRLRLELTELEHLKAAQISDTRSQLQVELQNLKRQHLSNTELYELEIRKLKDMLQRKDYQLEEAKSRISRAFSQNEFEIVRLREEKERLRNELGFLEMERKKEADSVRSKLETYYLSEIESMKKTHLANLEAIEFENLRLKDSLTGKNQEIESLLIKQQKVKQNSDETQGLLRSQNEALRQKLIELQRIGEVEFESLRIKLQGVHESEIDLLRQNNHNFVSCLQQEIAKLESLVNAKNLQMETLIKERGQARQIHEAEVARMRIDAQVLLTKVSELESNLQNTSADLRKRLQQKEDHIDYLNGLSATQNSKHSQQLESLRKLISHKEEELEAQQKQHREIELHLKESLARANQDADKLREDIVRIEHQRTNEGQDLKDNYQAQINQLKEKLEGASNKYSQAKKEADMLRENLELKEREVATVKKRLQGADDAQKRLAKEVEELRTKLLNKDRENNKIVEEQRSRLEKTFSYQLESLKADHANALKSERMKISELEAQIRKRDLELDDLLKKYKKLEEGFFELTQQEANRKELTLKFPGATADLMATKNLFDVFIKSKVLDLAERPPAAP